MGQLMPRFAGQGRHPEAGKTAVEGFEPGPITELKLPAYLTIEIARSPHQQLELLECSAGFLATILTRTTPVKGATQHLSRDVHCAHSWAGAGSTAWAGLRLRQIMLRTQILRRSCWICLVGRSVFIPASSAICGDYVAVIPPRRTKGER